MCETDGACCGPGLVEEHGKALGLIVLQPHETIPPEVSARGFELGHCVLGMDEFAVVQLTFQFVGFKTTARIPSAGQSCLTCEPPRA